MQNNADIIIIGAGAAGMMAALTAARRGRSVLLLEKMDQAGRKLRLTGKGRCNLTNTATLKDFITHVGSDGRFMRNAFSQFFNQELMDLIESLGVPLVVERGCRVFPQSGKSLDIFLALITALEQHPLVTIRKNTAVRSLVIEEGHAVGVKLQNGENLRAESILISTGGLSYPTTGSTGAGYMLASEVGHTVIPQVPSLVPLICQESVPEDLENFTLKNVSLLITEPSGKKVCEHFGEMTFTSDGISGPIVLSTSRILSRRLNQGEQFIAHIDLKPAVERNQLDKRLISDLNANGTRVFNDALRLWLPAEMIPLALQTLHIEYYKRLNQINGEERRRLLSFLKDLRFTLVATRTYNEAIITQGGVSLKEVNPKTMESKLVPGLYFAGEVLDLDADTGGYNLQIAFSTAHAAGMVM